jgi:hypothetical protein
LKQFRLLPNKSPKLAVWHGLAWFGMHGASCLLYPIIATWYLVGSIEPRVTWSFCICRRRSIGSQ